MYILQIKTIRPKLEILLNTSFSLPTPGQSTDVMVTSTVRGHHAVLDALFALYASVAREAHGCNVINLIFKSLVVAHLLTALHEDPPNKAESKVHGSG